MKTVDLDPTLFIDNRRRLKSRLLPNSIVVVNANDVMPTNADGTMAFRFIDLEHDKEVALRSFCRLSGLHKPELPITREDS